MFATIVTFNVIAVFFAFLAFRLPKTRQFDVESARRKNHASSRETTWELE